MELRQNVRVRTDAGQEALLRSALVNFKAGTVVSKEPVTVSLGNGVIKATGLTVTDNGKVMQFKGRVQTVFEASSGEAGNPPPAAPAQPSLLSAPATAAEAQPTSFRP
jgi:lipopolysaccharide export system protein LptC